jgi:hypothetical protein
MIRIPIDNDDSPQFIKHVENAISGIAKLNTSDGLIIVKIDNWFDWKWLHYRSTVPPFVPNHVVWQRQFDLPSGKNVRSQTELHIGASGLGATKRRIAVIAPSKSLVWYSGKSESTGHGAMMAYIPREEVYWCWYASFLSNSSWRPSEMRGISRSELKLLSEQVAHLKET